MDELIKRHRGNCRLSDQRAFNCDCDYYAKYFDYIRNKPNQRKSLKTSNKRRAEQAMRKLLRDLAAKEDDQRVKISQAMEWAANAAATPETAESLRCRGRMVINAIGDLVMQDITDADLLALRDKERARISRRGRPVKDRTIKAQILALRTMARVARDKKGIAGIPDLKRLQPPLDVPALPHGSKQTILTKAEAKQLIAYWKDKPERQAWVIVCLYTGAERKVVPQIRIDHTRNGRHFLALPGTKNQHRQRIVPASKGLERYLASGLELPVQPWPGSSAQIPEACEELGITRATPHDLRRTFCSWMAMAGVPELTCAKLMGHGSTRMVREVYAWLTDETKLEAVDVLPDLFEDDDCEE